MAQWLQIKSATVRPSRIKSILWKSKKVKFPEQCICLHLFIWPSTLMVTCHPLDKKNIDGYEKDKDNTSLLGWKDLQKRIWSLKQTFDDITGKINMATGIPSRNGAWIWRGSISPVFCDNSAMEVLFITSNWVGKHKRTLVDFSHKAPQKTFFLKGCFITSLLLFSSMLIQNIVNAFDQTELPLVLKKKLSVNTCWYKYCLQ